VTIRFVTPILNVLDVRESVGWFEQLGWEAGFLWTDEGEDKPNFGSVRYGDAEIFLCLDGQGSRGTPPAYSFDESTGGVWMSWFLNNLDDVDAMHALAARLGLDVTTPTDQPWGVREFHLHHPDGHTFRVGCHGRRGDEA
jgi:hypothetical protein